MKLSRNRSLLVGAAFLIVLGVTAPATAAQESPPADEPAVPAWGTNATHVVSLSAMAFVADDYTMQPSWVADSSGQFRYLAGGPDGCFSHSVPLQSGALVEAVAVDGCDLSASSDIFLGLRRDPRGPAPGSVYPLAESTSGTPGCQNFQFAPSQPILIDHEANTYVVEVCLAGGTASSQVRFKAVRIYSKLQVSPAPASATFWDVPTNHWAFQHIEALASSGITAGCSATEYCPDAPLTRAQMAVFLAKALGLHWE